MLEEQFIVGLGEACTKKPEGSGIAQIKRKAIQNYVKIDIATLAHAVGDEGHAVVPARLTDMKADSFQSIQIFLLDFDGHKSDGGGVNVSFEEIKERAAYYKIPIAFSYKTLSCPEGDTFYKYRVAFILDFILKDATVAKFIFKALMKIFPEADSACKNLDRIFLGGKELVYLDESARFNLVQLLLALYEQLDRNKNLNRDLQNFMNKTGIACINDRIAMGTIDQVSLFGIENDAKEDPSCITLIQDSAFPSYFYVTEVQREGLHQIVTCRSLKHHRIDLHACRGICRLLDDFLEGARELDHMERFLLETNLNYIVGGSKCFEAVLRRDYDEAAINNWKRNQKGTGGYLPKSCGQECPYYEKCMYCSDQKNIVGKLLHDRKIIVDKIDNYVSLEQAAQSFQNNLEEAFRSTRTGIHLIKAQTAIGKTRAIKRLVTTNTDKKFLIAEPINLMKKEVYEDLKFCCSDVCMTESVRDNPFLTAAERDQYIDEHTAGNHVRAKDPVKKALERYEENQPGAAAAIDSLQKIIKGFNSYLENRVIITTHAMLVNIPQETISGFDCIIIDEDILYLQMLANIKTVSKEKVQSLADCGKYPYDAIARELMGAKQGTYYKADFYNRYGFHKAVEQVIDGEGHEQEEATEEGCSVDNYKDLVHAGAYVCDEKGRYQYFCVSMLPQAKYIVLSATLDADIYRAYFNGSMEVYEYASETAKYMGQLEQYVYHSLGRRDLSNKQQIYSFIEDKIKGSNDFCKISFMCEEKNRVLNIMNVHFGNAIGINCFKGMDIAIIGTPHKQEIGYKLPCAFLYGADHVNGFRIAHMRVSYKGKNFRFMSYENEYLRHYQMYCMESELEQCIGRARLLRFDCKVTVFSNFPCDQAHIHTSDYLKAYEREGLDAEGQPPASY